MSQICWTTEFADEQYIRHMGGEKWVDLAGDKDSSAFRRQVLQYTTLGTDEENESVRLAAQAQRFRDSNRIERATWRNDIRVVNAIEEYDKEIIRLLKKYGKNIAASTKKAPKKISVKRAGILQLSDLHLNELVELGTNKYDFTVASQRLQKLVDHARRIFKAYGISDIVIAMTGDLLNSDRRIDELLSQSTNRAMASLLAVKLLKQVLCDLAKTFTLHVITVTGNESRMSQHQAWTRTAVQDNYDITIFNILDILLEGHSKINFYLGYDPMEYIAEVGGKTILFQHIPPRGKLEKEVSGIIARKLQEGKKIDYVIVGHIHAALIGDTYARSGSLPGSNAYAEHSLNCVSRASQNIYIAEETGIHAFRIDLQDVTKWAGYDICKDLEAYNAKVAAIVKSSEKMLVVKG